MTSTGVIVLPQTPPERLRSIAEAADAAGVDELWLWEDCFWQGGISSMAAALAWTERLRVGVGLLPVPLRNVALTAMEVAALHRMFPGRPIVGVGHGVQDWMGQVGARVESPMTLLREYVAAARSLLRGDRLTTEGRYVTLADVGLDAPASPPPPIVVGAVGPRTLALSGEVADGTIFTGGTTAEQVRSGLTHVAAGRSAAGRVDDHHTIVFVHAATGDDAAARIEADRVKWGYETMDGISISGDAAAFAAGAQPFADAGADTIVFQPTSDDPDPEGFARFLGEQVRPLLASPPEV